MSAYDRPDYARLLKRSYGSQRQRIAVAKQLILDGHTDCRAYDNCFEMNDGDAVVSAIIGYALQNQPFREQLARNYPPQSLHDGLPERWPQTYYRHHGQELQIA